MKTQTHDDMVDQVQEIKDTINSLVLDLSKVMASKPKVDISKKEIHYSEVHNHQ